MTLSDAEFREKFAPKKSVKGICMECKQLPKVRGKHRCSWCLSKKEGTDHQVASRQMQWFAGENPEHCQWCDRDVPKFYMVSSKRCKACQLAAQRNGADRRLYGLETGARDALHQAQGGVCWGCRRVQRVVGLAIHHSHLTGEVCFLACINCNKLVLGNAQDDPMTLLRLSLGMYYPLTKPGNLEKIEGIIRQILNA